MSNNPINDRAVEPVEIQRGLNRREQFAAMALQGLLANSEVVKYQIGFIAETAVKHADALIEELKVK